MAARPTSPSRAVAGLPSGSSFSAIGAQRTPAPPVGRILRAEHRFTLGDTTLAIETDPVCGMQVDTETSDLKLEHDGNTYWFCGRGCLLEFRDEPDRFLDPDYVPSM
jgi:YHS domain-containing protein